MNLKLNYIWIILWGVIFALGIKFNINDVLANKGIHVIENQYYRFFTGLLVHANIVHLVANMVVLYFIVDFLNGQINPLKLLVFSIVVGTLSNFIFSIIYRESVSVGGSPIIFAMLGLLIALQLQSKEVARFTLESLQGKWIVGYAILSNIPFISGNSSTLLIHGISLVLAFLIASVSLKVLFI